MTDMSGTSIQASMGGSDSHDDGEFDASAHNRWDDEYKWNLDSEFATRLQRFLAANPHGAELLSGYRSDEHQQDLAEKAKEKHGDDWRKWAAPPGKSNHNRRVAGDLHYHSDEAEQWAQDNAHRFGLEFPMSHEPWHIEPLGLRSGGYVLVEDYDFHDSYTVGPYGTPNPADVVNTGLEGSAAMMNTLMTGALPPSSALDEAPETVAGPAGFASHDQALSGPGDAMSTEPQTTEDTNGDQS